MIQVDTIYKVYVGDTSAFLELGNDEDYPASYLTLKTTEKASQDWFGQINITLTPEYAIALGETLIKAAKDKQKAANA